MENNLQNKLLSLQPKIHGLAVGMTVGLSTIYFNNGCAGTGMCPTCGACATQLPILLLPLLADGGIMLTRFALSARKQSGQAGDSK
jgi:hypothetical protein